MIVVWTIRVSPRLPTLSPSFYREGPLWWPEWEAPEGHVLVHWTVAEALRQRDGMVEGEGSWFGWDYRVWWQAAKQHGVRSLFGVSVDTSGRPL